jgi:hypothetical protein
LVRTSDWWRRADPYSALFEVQLVEAVKGHDPVYAGRAPRIMFLDP